MSKLPRLYYLIVFVGEHDAGRAMHERIFDCDAGDGCFEELSE
jgi:hypothetical protein